ncbi:MAG TPA: branched-chain amino acid ABC transporter permease [Candidatus Limnocylindrales bacterium]|nr:branched-chain amino acid ABC transporter permease [Candidatus Limnocylindrales bacterium]
MTARVAARGGGIRARVGWLWDTHKSLTILVTWLLIGLALQYLVLIPPLSTFQPQIVWVNGFALSGIYILLALGLNIVVGFAGLLDLGYAAFFAIGSYSFALAASPQTITHLDVPFWPMLLVGAVIAALFGVLLGAPTLRLRGDYLAIVTLGFGEIVPAIFLNADTYTRGTNGIGGIAQPQLPCIGDFCIDFNFINPYPFYWTMIAILAVVMVFIYRLQGSRLGRSWMAIREDELAAASSGINTITTKLLAFALGASTAGFAGVFNAAKLGNVDPNQFLFVVSFTVLAMVVLGGMGNIWGVVIGAFTLYTIQAVLLKQLNQFFQGVGVPILKDIDFVQYQFLLYGVALVAMMLLRPEGLFPSTRRRRELHEDTAEETDVPPPTTEIGN